MAHHDAHSVYRSGGGSARREFRENPREAERYYGQYITFVKAHANRAAGEDLLDLGCGNGWSSWLLSRQGYRVTGMDMDPRSFEAPLGPELRFLAGSALQLPFPDEAFSVVSSYQMLEHIEEPERALAEMRRVTRPDGIVMVAGPNLLSPLNSLRQIARGCWRNRPLATILIRQADDPDLPFGHTLPEALFALARNSGLIARKSCGTAGRLPRRTPDFRPPSRGDRDACNLLNPIDIAASFRGEGWRILATSFPGRPRWTGWLAGGTWVAARKGG